MVWCQRIFVGSALQTVGAVSKAASYPSEVISLNHPLKRIAYQSSNNFITTYIKARLWSSAWIFFLGGGLGSRLRAAASLFHSPRSFDLQSLPALFSLFLPSSLFPCLSSLNLSSSCCSYASPVLCSAVLITMPFSCLETEYDEEMWRGREHLLTQCKHWTLLYKEHGKFSS